MSRKPPVESDDDSFSEEEESFNDFGRKGNEDDDFDFGDESIDSPPPKPRPAQSHGANLAAVDTKKVQNQPFDEAVDLSDDGSDHDVMTSPESSPKNMNAEQMRAHRGDSPPSHLSESGTPREYDHDREIPGAGYQPGPAAGGRGYAGGGGSQAQQHQQQQQQQSSMQDPGSEESTSDEEDEDEDEPRGPPGAYNPSDYASLSVSAEVQELFQYIGRFKPHSLELDTQLKPFIPDYIPAVGEVDAFLKLPRPDGAAESLGLATLDEPALNQSDPTVLDLQLRAISKQSNLTPILVRSLEQADKNPKQITGWINSISDLHRTKPPPQVSYSKSMPDIESLMQVWPADLEEMFKSMDLPLAQLDVDLGDLTRMVAALLDIPVHGKLVETLHVVFTLYSEFKYNQHFNQKLTIDGSGSFGGESGMNHVTFADDDMME